MIDCVNSVQFITIYWKKYNFANYTLILFLGFERVSSFFKKRKTKYILERHPDPVHCFNNLL